MSQDVRARLPEIVTVAAHAKINLGLEVLGKLPDGYHDIATVMQRIALHDLVTCHLSDDLYLSCSQPELARPDNLVLRAARQLQEVSGTRLGATIRLQKAIPVAAGLGGGSSDAAATLRALCQLWDLRMDDDRLFDLALRLGSDVPFFMDGRTALAEGRGERLRPLRPPQRHWVVLAAGRAPMADKTRRLYGALEAADFSNGTSTRRLADALDAGRDIDPRLIVNCFERAAVQLLPGVRRCLDALVGEGAPFARLSGSGPAVYTLLLDEGSARDIWRGLRKRLPPEEATVLLTHTLE